MFEDALKKAGLDTNTTLAGNVFKFREEGDIGLFITLEPKVFLFVFGNFKLNFDCLVK